MAAIIASTIGSLTFNSFARTKAARARKLSLSALVGEAIHRQRRHAALGKLLSELGVKLTAAELAALRAELYAKV